MEINNIKLMTEKFKNICQHVFLNYKNKDYL